jgi:hypothetical protein
MSRNPAISNSLVTATDVNCGWKLLFVFKSKKTVVVRCVDRRNVALRVSKCPGFLAVWYVPPPQGLARLFVYEAVWFTSKSSVVSAVARAVLEQVISEYFGFPANHSFHQPPHNHNYLPSRAGTLANKQTCFRSSQNSPLYEGICLPNCLNNSHLNN